MGRRKTEQILPHFVRMMYLLQKLGVIVLKGGKCLHLVPLFQTIILLIFMKYYHSKVQFIFGKKIDTQMYDIVEGTNLV